MPQNARSNASTPPAEAPQGFGAPVDTPSAPEAAAQAVPARSGVRMTKGGHVVLAGTAKERVQLQAEGWSDHP